MSGTKPLPGSLLSNSMTDHGDFKPQWVNMCIDIFVIIDSGNGRSPVQCQAITQTNADSCQLTVRHKLQWKFDRNYFQQNENVVCKVSAILFRLQCVSPHWSMLLANYSGDVNLLSPQYCIAVNQRRHVLSWVSLGMRPVNERRRYIVTTSLIGCEHTLMPVLLWKCLLLNWWCIYCLVLFM